MNLVSDKKIGKMQLFKTKRFYTKIKNADANKFSGSRSLKNIWHRSLKNIKLVDGIEIIGEYAFGYCKKLKTVVLPDSVKEIKHHAFYLCIKLEEIVLPEKLEYIGESAFFDCQSLKKIIIPKNIRKILETTFCQCKNLEEAILPEGLEYIGENAFLGCEKLKRIVIPKNVKKIDLGAFSACSNNLEIYDQATNMRFINDINYNYDKDKSIDEIIIDLCSKYDIVKEKLLFLAKLRLWPKYYEKLNYEDEYNSFINYCKNNLFVSLEKANFESQKRINSNSINDQKKDLVPWYASYIPGFIIPMDAEADTLDNNVPRCISELVDEETLLLEKLGITKDKYGYWKDGDIIPELKVKEIKKLVKTNNHNKLS